MSQPNQPLNVAENLVADKGNMTVSTKLMKYAIGMLIGGTISILMFAYGLYWKAEDGRKEADKALTTLIATDKQEILTAIKELEKEEIKPNTQKNIAQDMSLMLVLERTNTLGERVNGNYQRPPSIVAQPTVTPTSALNFTMAPTSTFDTQNVVSDTTESVVH